MSIVSQSYLWHYRKIILRLSLDIYEIGPQYCNVPASHPGWEPLFYQDDHAAVAPATKHRDTLIRTDLYYYALVSATVSLLPSDDSVSFINPTSCQQALSCLQCFWRCWLGGRKGIWPVKNWVVGCWRGYLSGAGCRLAYGPADATATYCLLLQ